MKHEKQLQQHLTFFFFQVFEFITKFSGDSHAGGE